MRQEMEYEYKTMLTREEYFALLPFFHDAVKIEQVNHYFLLPPAIQQKHRLTLRIRQIGEQYRLQLKEQVDSHQFKEREVLLTTEEWEQACQGKWKENEILQFLQTKYQLTPEQLHYAGTLTTVRHQKEHPLGLFCCDHNTYLGTEDYELEVEVAPSTPLAIVLPFLEQQGIKYKQAPGKMARFWQRLQQKNKEADV